MHTVKELQASKMREVVLMKRLARMGLKSQRPPNAAMKPMSNEVKVTHECQKYKKEPRTKPLSYAYFMTQADEDLCTNLVIITS